ncbi:MAG: DUF3333 domain-containing protein, partial [Thalassolituus sp.]
MTDSTMTTRQKVEASMKRRRAAETRFRMYGMASVMFGMLCLVVLFGDIFSKGTSAFVQTVMTTEIKIDAEFLGINAASEESDL